MRVAKPAKALLVAGATLAALVTAAPGAQASPGICSVGDACLYYNSFELGGGAFIGIPGTVNYTTAYKFGPSWENGGGQYVKNNAAYVFNSNSNYTLTIYYNSNQSCAYACQSFAPNGRGNLKPVMKNNNASQGWTKRI